MITKTKQLVQLALQCQIIELASKAIETVISLENYEDDLLDSIWVESSLEKLFEINAVN